MQVFGTAHICGICEVQAFQTLEKKQSTKH